MGAHVTVSPKTALRRRDVLIQAPLDDSIIILSIENSRYYGGDKVAADVWDKFDGVRDVQAIAEDLAVEYDAPLDAIISDVIAFASEMLREGLLELA